MGVSVALSAESLDVVPGEETVCTLTVRNTGSVIDQISVDVVGAAAAWSVVEPALVNLYPGDVGEVRVHLKPPRAAKPGAGKLKFGVRATSLEDPSGSSTAEGTLVIAPFTELRVVLVPEISRGSRSGKHKIDVSNLGNVAVSTQITAVDPDDALTFTVPRPAVAPAGQVTQSRLVAVPRRKFWSGKQEIKPFQVVVQPERGAASTVEATFEQDPLVPRWVLGAAVASLALAVVLAGLWFTLVRPGIASAATEAAKVEASKQAAAGDTAAEEAAAAAAGAAAASPAPSASGSAKPAKKPEPGSPGNPLTIPTQFRIQTDVAPGNTFTTKTYAGQGAKALDVTDLQLQNPNGDTGLIEIRRGTQVVYQSGLENFRDLSQAYVTPIRFSKGDKLVVAVMCLNPAPEKKRCSAGVTVVGKTA
jgi:hypothetical protein